MVHHAVLQVRAPGTKYIMDTQPGVPFEAPPDPVKTGEDRGEGEFGFPPGEGVEAVAVFVPGGAGNPGAPGCARLVKAGSDFIIRDALHAERKAGNRPHTRRDYFLPDASRAARDQRPDRQRAAAYPTRCSESFIPRPHYNASRCGDYFADAP